MDYMIEEKSREIVNKYVLMNMSGLVSNRIFSPSFDYKKVMEIWAVQPYLARVLEEKGEAIAQIGKCDIWGRTSSGKEIHKDPVIQAIADELL